MLHSCDVQRDRQTASRHLIDLFGRERRKYVEKLESKRLLPARAVKGYCDEQTFGDNLRYLTGYAPLNQLDWRHVVIAGGAVVRCLRPVDGSVCISPAPERSTY